MEEVKLQEALIKWGFKPNHCKTAFNALPLTPTIKTFLNTYVKEFPPPEQPSLLMGGDPMLINKILGYIVRSVTKEQKIKRWVVNVDIPTIALDASRLRGDDYQLYEQMEGADLVILREIGFAEWSKVQQIKIYTLINLLYQGDTPVIYTNSGDPTVDLETLLGSATASRIEETCEGRILRIKNITK